MMGSKSLTLRLVSIVFFYMLLLAAPIYAAQPMRYAMGPNSVDCYHHDGTQCWSHTLNDGVASNFLLVRMRSFASVVLYVNTHEDLRMSRLTLLDGAHGQVLKAFDFNDPLSTGLPKVVAVDSLSTGEVDKIYISFTDGRIYRIDTSSTNPAAWQHNFSPLFYVPGKWFISKPMITRARRNGNDLTQVFVDKVATRSTIIQWREGCQKSTSQMGLKSKCVQWIRYIDGLVSQPIVRQQYLIFSVDNKREQHIMVLNNITGETQESCRVNNQENIAMRGGEFLEPKIMNGDLMGSKQIVVVQTNRGFSSCEFIIDSSSLGRKTWRYGLVRN